MSCHEDKEVTEVRNEGRRVPMSDSDEEAPTVSVSGEAASLVSSWLGDGDDDDSDDDGDDRKLDELFRAPRSAAL